jgi:hypothetical protein
VLTDRPAKVQWRIRCPPNIIDFRKRNSIEKRDASLTHGDTHLRYARDRHARLFGNKYAAKEHEALPAAWAHVA